MVVMELFTLLPFWYQSMMVFLLGLIIGSFLNVVIYRYHTGKSLSGHSHCLSCGHVLRWYELFPLVSYVCLRGHCRSCGCIIPARYFLVEIATAFLFLMAFLQFGVSAFFVFSVVLIAVLMVIAVYDIYHMVIPDELVLLMSVLALAHYAMVYGLSWEQELFVSHAGAALGSFLFYGGLWFVSKGTWIGFGDAKLAIPLGFILGASATFSVIVFSFWIGAVLSLSVMIIPVLYRKIKARCSGTAVVHNSKSFTMKSEVPFAPFMIIAFLLVYLYQYNVLNLMSFFI